MIVAQGYVMLGKTVPEQRRSDGRTFVCSAGYHPDLGLARIYPLAMRDAPADWSLVDVQLQRNPKDSRGESWQLAADRTPGRHDVINSAAFRVVGKVARDDRRDVVPERHYVAGIRQANAERRSLALVRPADFEIVWTRPDSTPVDMHQLELITAHDAGATARWDRIPRLRFTDGDSQQEEHFLQVREWGLYELIRKHGAEYAAQDTARALHLTRDSVLLVGNVNNHRNAWLVIKVLNLHGSQMHLPLTA